MHRDIILTKRKGRLTKTINILIIFVFLNTFILSSSHAYTGEQEYYNLAVSSIFNERCIDLELALVIDMAIKGVYGDRPEFKSRFNINAALAAQKDGVVSDIKKIEVLTNPEKQSGPNGDFIEIYLRLFRTPENTDNLKICFYGDKIDDIWDQDKVSIFNLPSPRVLSVRAKERPEPIRYVPFEISYPIDILGKKKVGLSQLSDRDLMRKRLKHNVYFANAPPERKKDIINRTINFRKVAIPLIEKYLQKEHPELEVLNISYHGSYPYGKKGVVPGDVDLFVVVRGNYFQTRTETIDVGRMNGQLKDLARKVSKFNLSIRGEDNFKYCMLDKTSSISYQRQKYLIERTISVVYSRNIVLTGYDFKDNRGMEKRNIPAQISLLLNNAYEYLFRVNNRLASDPDKALKALRKVPTRLYMASLYLKRLFPELDLNVERFLVLREKNDISGNVSFREIEEAWAELNDHFEAQCVNCGITSGSSWGDSVISNNEITMHELLKDEGHHSSDLKKEKNQQYVMRKRFAELKENRVKGVILDIDNNLTDPAGRRIDKKALDMIFFLRMAGIPVKLNTERIYRWVGEGESEGRDLESVLQDIAAYLKKKKIPAAGQESILNGLYVSSEGGLFISNGFLREDPRWKSYEEKFFKKVGIKLRTERDNKIERFLDEIDMKKHGLYCDMKLAKERSFSFFDRKPGNKDRLNRLSRELPAIMADAGLFDDDIRIFVRRNRVIVAYYPVDKSISLRFFDEELGIRNDREGIVVTAGDLGGKKDGDHSMLCRKGGLSTDKFDPDDPNMIALSLISGEDPGFPSLLWAFKQFDFISPQNRKTVNFNDYISNKRKYPEAVRQDDLGSASSKMIFSRAGRYLKGCSIDMKVDADLIPENDIRNNVRTWIRIMSVHNRYGLDIRYFFTGKNFRLQQKLEKVLYEEIEKDPSLEYQDKLALKEKINPSYRRGDQSSKKVIVSLLRIEDLQKMKNIPDNTFPIAMKDNLRGKGTPLMDFVSATSMGLAQAACFIVSKEDKVALPFFIELDILPKIRKICSRFFPDDDISELITKETIMNMIGDDQNVRKQLAVSLAIPPVVQMPVDLLVFYHEKIQFSL